MRIYAVGDIHGQLDMLVVALDSIEADRKSTGDRTAPVVFLGDYTDRGPDSRKVIDLLVAGRDAGEPWIFLKGNHDRMFLGFIEESEHQDPILRTDLTWLHERLGGAETLASYGVHSHFWTKGSALRDKARASVPEGHVTFLRELRLWHQTPTFFFCHAGVRPGIDLDDQSEDDLIWIRSPFLEDTRDFGRIVVHGHTPVDEPEHHGNRIALDTGAGYFRSLSVAVFEGTDVHILTDLGRKRLLPIGT